mmetsp:Transcript_138797/g.241503  ORF Transcript_138797/g.241503 Transcript_138797/m.241503 type:complete len:420 (-) Transcript_138797:123-1382(-)
MERVFERKISICSDNSDFINNFDRIAFAEVWEEDATHCRVCNNPIGKLRRHHCRICGRCVCTPCSPSSICLNGQPKLQRACTPCVSSVSRLPALKRRLVELGGRLSALSESGVISEMPAHCERHPSSSSVGVEACAGKVPESLEEATAMCEASLLPLEEMLLRERQRAEISEMEAAEAKDELRFARVFLLRLGEHLHAMHGTQDDSLIKPAKCDVKEAAKFCEAALHPLTQELERRWGSRGRSRSATRGKSTSTGGKAGVDGSECSAPVIDVGADDDQRQPAGKLEVVEEDVDCTVCGARLGKRLLRRRHHCRICGRLVCSNCSPSLAVMDGEKQPVRACTPCIGNAANGPALRRRLLELGNRLCALGGDTLPEEKPCSGVNLEPVLSFCELALVPLEEMPGMKTSNSAGTRDSKLPGG